MGISCYLAGNLYFYAWNQRQDVPPFPSWADAGYLGFFPFAVLAVLLSMRARLGRLQGTVLLDGLVGGLAAATAGAFVLSPLVDVAGGADRGVLVAAAYPIADVVLVAMVFGVFSAGGGLTGDFYRWLAAGLLTFVLADAIYGFRTTSGSYTPGTEQ